MAERSQDAGSPTAQRKPSPPACIKQLIRGIPAQTVLSGVKLKCGVTRVDVPSTPGGNDTGGSETNNCKEYGARNANDGNREEFPQLVRGREGLQIPKECHSLRRHKINKKCN